MVSFIDFSFHGVYPNEDWDFASFYFEMTEEKEGNLKRCHYIKQN